MRKLGSRILVLLLALALGLQAWLQAVPRAGAPSLLRSALACGLLVAGALGLGRSLALRLGLRSDSLFQEAFVGLGLGLAGLSALAFGLGAAGVLYPWLAWAGLAGLLLGTYSHLEHYAGYLRRNLKLKRPWDGSTTEVALGLASGWTVLAMLALALAPVSFYDALVYHLADAQRAAATGAFKPQEAVLFSWLPSGAGQLWALALALDSGAPWSGPHAASLLNLAAAGILVLGLTDLCARLASPRRQWTAGALLLAQPLAALAFAVFGADGWAALYCSLSLYAFLLSLPGELDASRGAWRLAAFLFAGVAISMKPVAGMHAAALVLLSLAVAWKEPTWRRPAGLLALVLALLLPLLPWLLRNGLLLGNPLYPFGLGPWKGAVQGYFEHLGSFGGEAAAALPWWRLPTALSFESGKLGGGGHLLILFLALAPAALLVKHPAPQKWLAFYAALSLPLWALGPHVERYYLTFVPALAVYAAFLLEGLEAQTRSRGLALGLRALVCAAAFLGAAQTLSVAAKDFDPFRASLGLEAPEAYLSRMGVQTARAGAWLRGRLGPRARGLVLGEARSALLPAGSQTATVFEAHPALPFLAGLDRAQDLAGKLRQKGYDFVLVNRAEGARTGVLEGLAPRVLPPAAKAAWRGWLEQRRALGGEQVFEADGVLAVALR